MVNENLYRYLWTMEKAEEEALFDELAALGTERTQYEKIVETLAEKSRASAESALRRGMKPSRVARALQYTDGYVRKIRSDAKIPPDPRYANIEPPKRNIGFGSVSIGDTLEEAIANSGPIDYGTDLRALVMATPRQRIANLVERLRRDDTEWYRSMQDVVNAKSGDVAVEILVYALAENRLSKADFAG